MGRSAEMLLWRIIWITNRSFTILIVNGILAQDIAPAHGIVVIIPSEYPDFNIVGGGVVQCEPVKSPDDFRSGKSLFNSIPEFDQLKRGMHVPFIVAFIDIPRNSDLVHPDHGVKGQETVSHQRSNCLLLFTIFKACKCL